VADGDDLRASLERAHAEIALRSARIAGLEQLIARAEATGRDTIGQLVSLLRELGVEPPPGDIPPSMLPDVARHLSESLVHSRNQLGSLVEEIRTLSDDARKSEAERERLLERIADLETGLCVPIPSSEAGAARGGLRVLMVSHDFLPRHRGGVEVYAWRLAKELARHHEIRLLCTESHPGVPSYRVREDVFDGIPVTEISHQHVASSFERSWRDPKVDAIFRGVLREFRPDVVHVQHLAYLSLGLIRIAKAAGVPVVFTLHDYGLLCIRGGRMLREDRERCERPQPDRCAECVNGQPLRDGGADGVLGAILGRLPDSARKFMGQALAAPRPAGPAPFDERVAAVEERLAAVREAIGHADLLISPSAWLRRTFVDSGFAAPDRIVVSENGQEAAEFRAASRSPAEALRVGFLGAVVVEKGVHVLVEAMNQLADLAGLECSIHGVVDADPEYARALAASSRNPRLRFAGPFEPSRVAEVLGGFDVLVVPSIWWENSPLVIQEAFLAGVPVVTSGIGAMAEKVTDGVNGLHFPAGDARALAAQLRRLHGDRGLLARLSAGRPLVKTIAEDARDLERRYEDLVRASPRSRDLGRRAAASKRG
jgi:glycosyltransferase involved in cell wall biosynthesis